MGVCLRWGSFFAANNAPATYAAHHPQHASLTNICGCCFWLLLWPAQCRYYESVQISSGTSFSTLTPAHSTTFFNTLLFAAIVLAGAYAAVTAAFARNYDLTLYGQCEKWKLLLLWPVLALSSKTFWRQFSSALRGEKVKVKEVTGDGSSGS